MKIHNIKIGMQCKHDNLQYKYMWRDAVGSRPLTPWQPAPVHAYNAFRADLIRSSMRELCLEKGVCQSRPKCLKLVVCGIRESPRVN